MTRPVEFGRLEEAPLRAAWAHEALGFTPWLSENLGRLAEVLGIPLESAGSEVAVGPFSADIVARNPEDDSLVLIENQLEEGDHRHLGQILTYLAGLEAQTIVWIAPRFRDEHLSAIRWLNAHTVEPFAFFAVRVRVVRIADSPLAPLFEVIERPNTWDRQLQEVARESRGTTALGAFRREFWTHFLERHPSERVHGDASAASNRSHPLPAVGLAVVQYLAKESVGVFVRGDRGTDQAETVARIATLGTALEQRLGVPAGSTNGPHFFVSKLNVNTSDRSEWDRMSDWLKTQADRYVAALNEITEGRADGTHDDG